MLDPTKRDDGRRWLLHTVPPWIDPEGTNFFVTVYCQRRGTNQLCSPGIGDAVVSAARFLPRAAPLAADVVSSHA